MDQIIDDFIKSRDTANGYGFFKYERSMNHGEKDVVDFAMEVGKCQAQKYKRYQVVPAAFISYLRYLQVIPEDLEIPKDKKTIKGFADLFCEINCEESVSQGLADFIKEYREQNLKKLIPEMHVLFVSGEKLGHDLYKQRNGLSLKKRQGYKGQKKKIK